MTEPNVFQKLNAKRKKWKLIAKRTKEKHLREGTVPTKPTKKKIPKPPVIAVYPGDVFDKLTVVEPRPSSMGFTDVALFSCSGGSPDCAKEVITRISRARSNLKSGWCSCEPCYRAEGGIEIWKQKRAPALEIKVSRPEKLKIALPPIAPVDLEPVKKRILEFVAGRHAGVKVTTVSELQNALKESRTMVTQALVQLHADGLLRFKRTRYANGYVSEFLS